MARKIRLNVIHFSGYMHKIVSLEIKKKSGSSLNPDIHHSKVASSGSTLNFKKPVFDFSALYPKKSGLSKKSKVSTLDIRIKQSGLMVSYSKVPSSDHIYSSFLMIR